MRVLSYRRHPKHLLRADCNKYGIDPSRADALFSHLGDRHNPPFYLGLVVRTPY